jgi:adenylate cyclase
LSIDQAAEDKEYERRFLVADEGILEGQPFDMIGQAYLFVRGGWAVRIRRTFYRASAYRPDQTPPEGPITLTVKGPRSEGERAESPDWELPREMALALFRLSDFKVFKARYSIVDAGTTWDVDRFELENQGLIIAECEMYDVAELWRVQPPPWCGKEVTGDARFNNEELARHPYRLWRWIYPHSEA